jgi:rare lipoprotein A
MSGPTRPFVNNTPSAASPTMRTPVSRCFVIAAAALTLAACTTTPRKEPAPQPAPDAKYYKDDGPGDAPPAGLDALADAVPVSRRCTRFANRPYTVFGREYVPATSLRPYKERGVASWYGRKFHGERHRRARSTTCMR